LWLRIFLLYSFSNRFILLLRGSFALIFIFDFLSFWLLNRFFLLFWFNLFWLFLFDYIDQELTSLVALVQLSSFSQQFGLAVEQFHEKVSQVCNFFALLVFFGLHVAQYFQETELLFQRVNGGRNKIESLFEVTPHRLRLYDLICEPHVRVRCLVCLVRLRKLKPDRLQTFKCLAEAVLDTGYDSFTDIFTILVGEICRHLHRDSLVLTE